MRTAIFLLLMIPALAFGQDLEVGKGEPWDVISIAAGAAGALFVKSVGQRVTELLNSVLDLWIFRIKAKIMTLKK